MKQVMKAVVVRAPMDFSLEEVPVPEADPKGILLKVEACGLCGSDLRTLKSGHGKVVFPWIIGHETCGIVVATGPGYEGSFGVGDRIAVGPNVYCGRCEYCINGKYDLCENLKEIAQAWPGAFAEYLAVPGECVSLGNIQAVPEGLDPVFAGVIEPMSSCVNAHEKLGTGLGDHVVIIGSGPVGCIHTGLARLRGASRITLIDIDETRLKLASGFTPDRVIDASKTDPVDEVLRDTRGAGADIVITATPAPVACVQALDMAKKGGRIAVFGGLPKENSVVQADFNKIHYKGLQIVGITAFAPRHNRTAMNLAATGRFPMGKLVTHRFMLEDFKAGAALALEGKSLKVVFVNDGALLKRAP